VATAVGVVLGGSLMAGPAVAQAATFTVTKLDDAGAGTLRQAITDANAAPDADTITFADGVKGRIELASRLPIINHAVDIQGPGARALTVDGNGHDTVFTVDASGDQAAQVTIAGLTITGGGPDSVAGSGIRATYGTVTVSRSTIIGNTSTSRGGGIAAEYGSLTLQNSTVSGNSVSGDVGGGVFSGGADASHHAQLTILDSTISGNTADTDGGGIFAHHGDVAITGSTIAGNTAHEYGGGIGANYTTVSVQDSVVAGNDADLSAAKADAHLETATSLTAVFSLLQVPGAATTDASDITGVDPQLSALADNGGPTDTMMPAATSPVIDKGKAFGLTADQRGLARPVDYPGVAMASASGADGSDMGAVERQLPAPTTTTTTTTPTTPAATDPLSDALVLGDLTKPFGAPSFTSKAKALTFTTSVPEPGSVLFGLDLSFYKGASARAAKVHRPIHLGQVSMTATKAGSVSVTIPISARARRLLQRHPKARLVVRTYFTTAIAKHHLNTSRTIKPAHRPR
jgi:hypothetical protein